MLTGHWDRQPSSLLWGTHTAWLASGESWTRGALGPRPDIPGQSQHPGPPGSLSGVPLPPGDFPFQAHTWPRPASSQVIPVAGGAVPDSSKASDRHLVLNASIRNSQSHMLQPAFHLQLTPTIPGEREFLFSPAPSPQPC